MEIYNLFNIEMPKKENQGYSRGDKNMWNKLKEYDFKKINNENVLVDLIYDFYLENTGINLIEENEVYCKNFDDGLGGISNGIIISNYWLNVALPFLLERL